MRHVPGQLKAMDIKIEYLRDDAVDADLDRQLRTLLSTCFTKPEDHVFKERRYFIDPYPHRWIIRGSEGTPVAHIGVHDREIHVGADCYRFGGIAEVCVHPTYRGKGYVKHILVVIHAWLKEQGIPFAILMGDPKVYSSSGYSTVSNIVHGGGSGNWEPFQGMVCQLGQQPWPEGEVRLPGAVF